MADFGIRFFLCNILICIIIAFLIIVKRVFKNDLSSRMQFNLWFLLLGILVVPFVPFRPASFTQILALFGAWKNAASSNRGTITESVLNPNTSGAVNQMNDFALSVRSKTPSMIGVILCGIWLAGILAMILFVIKSASRLNAMKKSALPLQNKTVRIYLPIHLISDFNAADLRYMLLHELQHYRHKDALAGFLMNIFGVLYWCNPCVWYALKEMRCDREVACDTSVLNLLDESDYENYGNTLLFISGQNNFHRVLMPCDLPYTTVYAFTIIKQFKVCFGYSAFALIKNQPAGSRSKGEIFFQR